MLYAAHRFKIRFYWIPSTVERIQSMLYLVSDENKEKV